jgi:hypothetical protein
MALNKSRHNSLRALRNRPRLRSVLSSSAPALSHNQAQQRLSQRPGYRSLYVENGEGSKRSL